MIFSNNILKQQTRRSWTLVSKITVFLLMPLLQSTQFTSQTATDEALVLISSAFFPCILRIKFSFSLDYEFATISGLHQFLANSRKILIQVVFHFTIACHLILCRFQLRADPTDAILHLVYLQIELQYRLLHVPFLQSIHSLISHQVL